MLGINIERFKWFGKGICAKKGVFVVEREWFGRL
jgi:hypothetical protein